MKTTHRLFFAIPFDSATKNLYDSVCQKIRRRYPGVTTIIGNEEVGPSQTYSDIASFKAQNRELTRQFVTQIQEADIVIADLTHNNPNVHIELGIALMQNKNILRVTGRSVSELGFDIRNLEVLQYKNKNQLTKIIEHYLEIFFRIKRLPISSEHSLLYFNEPIPINLRAASFDSIFDSKSNAPPNFLIRDGAVRVNFEILSVRGEDNWFGVYFRVGDSPSMGSHLVYVRPNGLIQIAVYPGPDTFKELDTRQSISGRQELILQFENNYLDVQLGTGQLQTDQLSHQTAGRVLMAAWNADVDVHSAEMVCRDTIEWD